MRFFHAFLVALCFFYSLESRAQSISQFNGTFNIQQVTFMGNNQYQMKGSFLDYSNVFSALNAMIGDRIMDRSGNMFEIVSLTVSGSEINAVTNSLDNNNGLLGDGIIFRPSKSGFPLITNNSNDGVKTSALNTATLSIDSKIPEINSGSALPIITVKNADVVLNLEDGIPYRYDNGVWKMLTNIPSYFFFPDPAVTGDVMRHAIQNKHYSYDGSSWNLLNEISSLPTSAKFGDIFYVTSERKLYMMSDDGDWTNISGASIPGGGDVDLPTAGEPGELFFNTDKNTLYVYDANLKWVEVSTDGSNPSGIINPDPAHNDVKPGSTFFNTADKRLYVYNGTDWSPTDNLLPRGQVYVGNSASIATPVTLSGDASIATNGIFTINEKAITDKKLDKDNIPLSGFAIPVDDISLGDASSKFRIVNLANPTSAQDAATKGYVDNLFFTPNLLALPNNNFFVGNAANKAVATPKTSISLSGFGPATTIVSLGNNKLTSVADPTTATDAATKNYVDTRVINPTNIRLTRDLFFIGGSVNTATEIAKTAIPISGFGAAVANVSFGDQNIIDLKDPLNPQDAATKNYIDSKELSASKLLLTENHFFKGDVDGKAEAVSQENILLSGFGEPISDVSFGGKVLSNLGAPLIGSDASTKDYVDGLFGNPDGALSLANGNLFVGDSQGQAKATPKNLIAISGFGKAENPIDMGTEPISNLKDPIDEQDAATKNYVDEKTANPSSLSLATDHILVGVANQAEAILKGSVSISDFGFATAPLELGKADAPQKIIYLADPENAQDAATKAYVDSKGVNSGGDLPDNADAKAGDIYYNTTDNKLYVYDGDKWVVIGSDGDTILDLDENHIFVGNSTNKANAVLKDEIPLSDFGNAKDTLSLGDGTINFRIANLADPVQAQDAATKSYVDSKGISSGTDIPAPADSKAGDLYYDTKNTTLYVFNGEDWMPLVNELLEHHFYIGDNTNRPIAISKENIAISGFGTATDTLSLGNGFDNFRIANLADPINDLDAVNKKYVDGILSDVTGGYMEQAIYDANRDSIVDNAAMVNGKSVESNVPENAVFSDELVKVGSDGNASFLNKDDFVVDSVNGIGIKDFDISKFGTIGERTLLGNNLDEESTPAALTTDMVKVMLELDEVDNTPDSVKHVYSATKLDPPLIINGKEHDGTADFTIDGDNLGNHTATASIKLGGFSISKDGEQSKGLSFDELGNAIFAQDVTVTSNFYTPSDQRLKTKVETLTEALESLDQIRGVRFEYIDQKKYMSGPKVGLIAQELQKVYPEMVTEGSDGFLKVDYTQLSAVLIQAVKEQQEQLKDQAKEIKELKIQMDKQQGQLDAIMLKLAMDN